MLIQALGPLVVDAIIMENLHVYGRFLAKKLEDKSDVIKYDAKQVEKALMVCTEFCLFLVLFLFAFCFFFFFFLHFASFVGPFLSFCHLVNGNSSYGKNTFIMEASMFTDKTIKIGSL